MKNIQPLLFTVLFLTAQVALGQNSGHLKLSTTKPVAGKKISFSYDTTGTALGGTPQSTVHFLNDSYTVYDVDLKPEGKVFKGEFVIPEKAKAFYIGFANGDSTDSNNGKGYLYEVYKGKNPVEGAYAMEAYLIYSGMGNYFGKIETDKDRAAALYKKEFAMHPKSEDEYLLQYLSFLSSGKDSANIALADAKIEQLSKKTDEKSLLKLSSWYSMRRKSSQADSVDSILIAKYPDGETVKKKAGLAFNKEKDLVKKDSLLKVYIAKYGDDKKNEVTIENFKMQMASAYLQAGNEDGYKLYASQLKNKNSLAGTLNNIAYDWAKEGQNLDKAASNSKESLDILDSDYANPAAVMYRSPKQAKESNRATYYNYADTYAFILYKQGKYAEALKYQKMAYDSLKYESAEVSEHYAMILSANSKYDEAKKVIEKAIQSGKGSEAMKDELKKIYVHEKGSEAGFNAYVTSLDVAALEKMREELAKTIINDPAPAFALKDFEGKTVSLADLKGKVVVLDFWATWCGPCKASFPGMQMAVNKYKDDANVKFLFIDTWESGDNYVPGVKKFIADNDYTFHVLIDEKGDDGRQSKVVSAYKVDGIPTKFIIDKTGNIRFKHVGFSGTAEGVLNEVSSMIDMLANPEAAKSAEPKKVNGK